MLAILHWDDPCKLCAIRDELGFRKRLGARIRRWSVDVRITQLEQLEIDSNVSTAGVIAPTDQMTSTASSAPVQIDEEFDEEVRDYVQASVVTLWGKDDRGPLVAI
jgi:hypothetical protein